MNMPVCKEFPRKLLHTGMLRDKFVIPAIDLEAQDEWERLVLSAGSHCGVSLSHEALSSEGLYE